LEPTFEQTAPVLTIAYAVDCSKNVKSEINNIELSTLFTVSKYRRITQD
jgi:hypothetical protein